MNFSRLIIYLYIDGLLRKHIFNYGRRENYEEKNSARVITRNLSPILINFSIPGESSQSLSISLSYKRQALLELSVVMLFARKEGNLLKVAQVSLEERKAGKPLNDFSV